MERFYPNFYSYTKSHYEPLVSNLLIKSESEHSCKPNTDGDEIHSNDNTNNNTDKIKSDWYSGIDCENYSENSNRNEQKHTIASSDINRQRMFKTKQSRGQLVDLTINESQRWARENSDPLRHNELIDDEILTDYDSMRSVQSFISPYIKINEHLTSEHKVKQNASYGTIENNANNLISASYSDIRCNIIPNYQHCPDLMSTSLTKDSSFIKRKSRSLHKQSNDHELHCTNHIDKTDSNALFGNGNRSKRLPSPCVLLRTAQETGKGPKLLPGHVQNTAISNYDLRPKRLIETERMVRQELASTRQKSVTYNNTISNNNSNIFLSKNCRKPVKQTSPRSLKKPYFNEKKHIIRSLNRSKYIMSDKGLSDNELHENNSTILINSRTNLSSKFENITTISNEMNYGNKSETEKILKDNKIETLEETMESMVVRIEQLQALDNFKNSEIHELQSIINQLRGDDMNSKSLASSPSHFQPKPPRSTSCRTLPDAMYQDLQDAISLNSFTSGTSAGSQDPSIHSQQKQKTNSKSDDKCSSQIDSSASALDTERSYVKHSHWLRASFSKAFRKRAKSNIRPNDSEILMNGSSTTNLQPTVHDQVTANNQKLQCEQQLDRLHLTVSRMRWQMDLLEARNKKLQEIILKYNPDELLRNELYTVKLEKKVSLYDLSTHHFQDSCQFVQVFVHTESICYRNLDKISNISQCRDQSAANDNSADTPINCIRSFKIGCTGLLDEMTWEDLDERLQKLIQYYINFLDPNNQLQLESLELQAYQLNFTLTEQSEIKTQSIVRSFTTTTLSSSSAESQSQISCTVLLPIPYTDEQINSQSPIVWINDMINKYNAKHYTLSIQIHLKGCTMKFPLQKDQKPPHQHVFEQKEMLKYVCFGSLIPLITLSTYLSTIRDNSIVIIYGASGTGKSQLVNDLTKILVTNPHSKNTVYNFRFKHDGSTTVKELKSVLTQQLNSFTNNGYPEVINLLNIQHFQGSFSDLFSKLKFSSNCPKIVGTSGTGNIELEKFLIENQIKVINHLSDINDAKEYLERSLNRKLIQYRLFNEFYSSHGFNEDKDSLNKYVTQVEDKNLNQLVSWLTEFWNQLNEIPYSLLQSNQFTIFGIRTFLTCPMHSQLSLNWFLDLWNNMLVPILFKDIKNITTSTMPTKKEPLNSIFKTLNNILGWITITWPWNPTIVNFPKSIREPKITLTQNSISMMKNYQLTLSTLCNSDVETCQHRTSMDSGIILDGINPTSNNLFNCFENNSNIMYGNNYYSHYHYPYGIGDNYNVQQHVANITDCNQLTTTTSHQMKNENCTRSNCTKTVTSMK
uniref:Neuron navigator 2 n=1 Tax=Schistosoma mansoni TaxID=6183 RepID=A0AA82N7J5_SCHMA